MSKVKVMLSPVAVFLLLFAGVASAEPSQGDQDSNLTQQLRQIHQKVVENGLASLTDDGQIVINATASELGVDSDLFDKYLQNMDAINFDVSIGGVSFDDHFNIKVGSQTEVAEAVYQNSLDKRAEGEQLVVPFSDPGAPVLQAYSIANSNYHTVVNYYNALATGIYADPTAAYEATVGMWVAKVRPGGDWDYKVVSGYSSYYKEWEASG
ncbi:hypothetical protein [Cohnella thermotolerans]|uniref:hypothetical protein n=1 Tax=Cohnella thermotolerans TaxID=329858 RepID=UPI0012EB3CBE|nr:hypothetical protein [Cohnella thermotolerans]